MEWKLYFFCLVAFLIGRASVSVSIYIGPDQTRYDAATLGILLTRPGDKKVKGK